MSLQNKWDEIDNQYKTTSDDGTIGGWLTKYRDYATGIDNVDTSGFNTDQLNLYTKDKTIWDSYRQAAKQLQDNELSLANQADRQRQQAYTDTMFAKKYLPQQQKANGLYGLGLSESAQIQLNNNYQNSVGSINSGYDRNKTSLTNNFDNYTNGLQSSVNGNAYNYNNKMLENRQNATDLHLRNEIDAGKLGIDAYRDEYYKLQDRLNADQYKSLLPYWQEYNAIEARDYIDKLFSTYGEDETISYRDYLKADEYLKSVRGEVGTENLNLIYSNNINNRKVQTEQEFNNQRAQLDGKLDSLAKRYKGSVYNTSHPMQGYSRYPGSNPKQPMTELLKPLKDELDYALKYGLVTQEEYDDKQAHWMKYFNDIINS